MTTAGEDPSLCREWVGACPQCGARIASRAWVIVDGDRRPDLVEALVDGTLQAARCGDCGYEAELDSELLIWRSGVFPQLIYVPSLEGTVSLERAGQEAESLCQQLRARANGCSGLAGAPDVCLTMPGALAQVLTRDVNADVDAHERGTLGPEVAGSYRRLLENLSRGRSAADDALKTTRAEAVEGSAEWVAATHSLAVALFERRTGDQESSVEAAIELLEDARQYRSRESAPDEWARIEMDLGIAYRRRLAGTRADNLELAIHHYRQAKEVMRADAGRLELATLECNMSAALLQRVLGKEGTNRAEALELARRSLPTIETSGSAAAAAVAWLTLGNALLQGTDRADELEEAEQCFSTAIDRYRSAGRLVQAGTAVLSLAGAISRRDDSRRPEAIELLRTALDDLPPGQAPVDRARALHGIGRLLVEETGANSADPRFREGTDCLRASLEVLTPAAHPAEAREAARELGEALSGAGRWEEAAEVLGTALEAAERLYGAALLGQARDYELGESGPLHHLAAFARARAGDLSGSVEALEGGRARWARSALAMADALASVAERLTPAERDRLDAARRELSRIDSLERNEVLSGPAVAGAARAALARRTLAAAAEVEGLAARLEIGEQPTDALDIAAQLDAGEGIVYLATTRWGSLALIVVAGGIHPVWCESFASAELLDALAGGKEGSSYLDTVLLDTRELERGIDAVLEAIGPTLLEPLARELAKLELDAVVLVPIGALGLLPLHAFPGSNSTGKEEQAGAQFEISYAPSAAVRNAAIRRSSAASRGGGFVAAANPLPSDDRLPFAAAAAGMIAAAFGGGRVLTGSEASKQEVMRALPGARHVHFGCHGSYERDRPLTSRLELADGTALTLRELLNERGLEGVRLVTAVACNSGLPQIDRAADEVPGFATAFLRAGAAGAIVALWPVQDLPAALFSTSLYGHLLGGDTPARALASTRAWLCQLTNREVAAWIAALPDSGPAAEIWRRHSQERPTGAPFRHPLHWAPYMLVGA